MESLLQNENPDAKNSEGCKPLVGRNKGWAGVENATAATSSIYPPPPHHLLIAILSPFNWKECLIYFVFKR
jgi:hypothetical protein